jgi:hypothetical protein
MDMMAMKSPLALGEYGPTNVSLLDRLADKRRRLAAELERVDAALQALKAVPEIEKVLEAVSVAL